MNGKQIQEWRSQMDAGNEKHRGLILGRAYFADWQRMKFPDRAKLEGRLERGMLDFYGASKIACARALELISQTGKWGW